MLIETSYMKIGKGLVGVIGFTSCATTMSVPGIGYARSNNLSQGIVCIEWWENVSAINSQDGEQSKN